MSVSRIPGGGIPARLPDSRPLPSSREPADRDEEVPSEDLLDLSADWFERIAPRVLLGKVLSLLHLDLVDTGLDLSPLRQQQEQLRHVGELDATAAALQLREAVHTLQGRGPMTAATGPLDLGRTVRSAVARGVEEVSRTYATATRDRDQVTALLRRTSDRMLAAVAIQPRIS